MLLVFSFKKILDSLFLSLSLCLFIHFFIIFYIPSHIHILPLAGRDCGTDHGNDRHEDKWCCRMLMIERLGLPTERLTR